MADRRIEVLLPSRRGNLARNRWTSLPAAVAVDEVADALGSGASVTVLTADVDRAKVLLRDRPVLALRRRASRGTGILLRAVGRVRKRVVGGDVIELRGRLVVPRAPRFRAVDASRSRLDRCRESCAIESVGSIQSVWIVVAASDRRGSLRRSCRRRSSDRSPYPSRRRCRGSADRP